MSRRRPEDRAEHRKPSFLNDFRMYLLCLCTRSWPWLFLKPCALCCAPGTVRPIGFFGIHCCVYVSAPNHATDLNIQKMCGCKVFQVVCPLRAWRTALSVGHMMIRYSTRLLSTEINRRLM